MKSSIITLLLALFCFHTGLGQPQASGYVYDDENKNGIYDDGEKGISGVGVSNGLDVVLTDTEGRYEINIDDDTILFVIEPSGYDVPVNSQNLPQFFYIHKPGGSPDLDFKGVSPTGELPEQLNFALHKTEETENFEILVFGDPQPYTIEEVEYFDRDIVSEVAGARGYQFGISLGDLVGDDLDLFIPYTESVSRVGIPWYNVYGNHDMNFDATSDQYADETFEATFGPATYSFNHGDVHFIIIDDVIYPRTDGEGGYMGGFTDRQFEFMKNDLRYVPKDKLIVVAFHIPPFSDRYDGRTFIPAHREKFFDLMDEYPNTLSLSAHTHIQEIVFYDEDDQWGHGNPHTHYNVGTTSGDWWSGSPDNRGIPPTIMRDGTPNGYAMINFTGNQYTFDYKVANAGADYKMSIWGPKVVPQNSWHSASLYVNYFLGSEKTQVEYRVNEGPWRNMQKAEEGDPAIADLRSKWDQAEELLPGKRPSNPVKSSHLWKAGVPNNLPLGTQTVQIKVTDMFGRTITDTYEYRVVEAGK